MIGAAPCVQGTGMKCLLLLLTSHVTIPATVRRFSRFNFVFAIRRVLSNKGFLEMTKKLNLLHAIHGSMIVCFTVSNPLFFDMSRFEHVTAIGAY